MERFERNCCRKDLKCRWWMVVKERVTWQNRTGALWPCDRLIKLVLLWPFARLGSVTWPAALNWEQLQAALFILYLKLEHGVGVVHGQEPLQPH